MFKTINRHNILDINVIRFEFREDARKASIHGSLHDILMTEGQS